MDVRFQRKFFAVFLSVFCNLLSFNYFNKDTFHIDNVIKNGLLYYAKCLAVNKT